ncbi:glycine zipper 2TM domain-containing protein [Planctomycetota bacterium]|nr:glycine zipper 2TM domain-containing protein [Planctomycetota bacterium]
MKINDISDDVRFTWPPLLALLAVCALMFGCASGESFTSSNMRFDALGRIGVVVSDGSDVLGKMQRKEVADLFGMQLMKKGYSIADRANLEEVITEVDFQQSSGITSGRKEKLRIKNINTMLVVNVSEFGERISMTAKMSDVSSGELLWMGEGNGSLKKGLGTIGGGLVGGLSGAVLGSQFDDKNTGTAIGAGAGVAAGALVGNALEPEQAKLARKVIQKMTRDLPTVSR